MTFTTANADTPLHTIGVFDSGFGGLTVLRALLPRLPGTHFVYLGDTARLPYGAKSQATVARYAIEAARFLVGQGADFLVIACNTATALALPEIRAAVPVPVLGVIEPGARAAQAAAHASDPRHPPRTLTVTGTEPSRNGTTLNRIPPKSVILSENPQPEESVILSEDLYPEQSVILSEAPQGHSRRTPVFANASAEGTSLSPLPGAQTQTQTQGAGRFFAHAAPPQILVLATTATTASHAYRDTCATLGLHATEMPCPLLVPLVEEGWTDHPVTRDVLRIYLTEALSQIEALTHTTPDAILLGCTHYPLIAPLITQTLRDLGCDAPIVDSAQATADATVQALSPGAPSSPTVLSSVKVGMEVRVGPQEEPGSAHPATFVCYATDSIEKFSRLGTHFLGQPIPEVHLLDLGG